MKGNNSVSWHISLPPARPAQPCSTLRGGASEERDGKERPSPVKAPRRSLPEACAPAGPAGLMLGRAAGGGWGSPASSRTPSQTLWVPGLGASVRHRWPCRNPLLF